MIVIFENFACETVPLPNNGVSVKVHEAMEGEGPDGKMGIVGTGNVVALKFDKEAGVQLCVDLAIKLGLMEDKDKPEVADLAQMREELNKRDKGKKGRPGR